VVKAAQVAKEVQEAMVGKGDMEVLGLIALARPVMVARAVSVDVAAKGDKAARAAWAEMAVMADTLR